ncbi:Spo0B domain-containing protein [Candidatus Contubernalis alkaliaceticus]|uniref:Spo0B domain-containing protein n=1 Tax=Candidatus Contubernalis alkaliaceticus TaxID=338645 RepID=UPI001F4C1762|nr:Spo0B domain-containing protein [Candidatus Contubernalis alkalaceticus]UNC93329.1 Spo0B domain-containing protein [Candidatus Contubernalis alkalaceticus]
MDNTPKNIKINQITLIITILLGLMVLLLFGFTGIVTVGQVVLVQSIFLLLIFLQFFRLNGLHRKELEIRELEGLKQCRNILRVWRHDFLNDLQMLLTLVQMKKYFRQMEYIKEITEKIHETGKILSIRDVSLALFLVNQYQEFETKNIDLKIIVESDLSKITADGRFCRQLFEIIFGLVEKHPKEEGECLLIISDMHEGVKVYFSFPGNAEEFDFARADLLKKKITQFGSFDLSFEEDEVTLQLLFSEQK